MPQTSTLPRVGAELNSGRARQPFWFTWLALLVPLFALSACATPHRQPDTTLPFGVPAVWSHMPPPTLGGTTSLEQWWRHFDDPLLGVLVKQALNNNLTVKTAQASLRQAWALRDVAAAALLPSMTGSASAQRRRSGEESPVNAFQAGANVNWTPDIFGVNHRALNAADAAAQSSAASLGDVQVSIAAEVGLSYVTLRSTQTRLEIGRTNLDSQQQTLQITQWRQQAGLVSVLEVEQARASVEQTKALLPALQTTIEQTRHGLAILTAQAPAALDALLAAPRPVPLAQEDLALTIPAETLRQRPDVRAAELNMLAAMARVAQANAARFPSFALGGSIGLNALTLGSLTTGASVVSSVLASIAMPIVDGGAARAHVRAQQAAFDQARLAYEAVVLKVLKEVEDALIVLQNDRQRRVNLQHAGEAASTASQLARQRYSSGLVDFQVVLETQRTQLNTQDALAGANADISSDHIRLYKALGGGWRPANDHLDGLSPVATKAASENDRTRTFMP